MRCPRCGHENQEGDRFCANCGARLTPVAPPRETPTESLEPAGPTAGPGGPSREEGADRPSDSIPPPVTPSFLQDRREREEVDDEWRMSSLGPPPPPRRRVWLWILVAIFATIVIACCAFMFFITATDTGQEWFSDFSTQVVEEATQQAR